MPLESFGEEKRYNFERIGSFGRFYTGNTFPIEYLMTTFSAAELSELSFARDIQPEVIDFDLLMQRDIDEERVRSEMEPYLNPQMLTPAEIRSRAIFFPPLLAAIIPTKGKIMQAYYSDEQGDIELHPNHDREHIIREWPGLFKLTYFSSNNPQAYRLPIYKGKDDDSIEVCIQQEPVQLEVHLSRGNQYGAKLVVIDGQHRLFTLRKVYEKQPELMENLGVPVCILFAPHSTQKRNREYTSLIRVPTVPEVFRHLFVDVNSTAKQVGGHFNILLADNNMGNIACRKFCDHILRVRGIEGLAVIEWNTKTKKQATAITRAYSLSSIGIIAKALTESIGHRKLLTKYLLKLDDIETELYPNGDDDPDYPIVQWDKFSLTQKSLIEEQIKTHLVPCLEILFFQTEEFAKAFQLFQHSLIDLTKTVRSEQADAADAQQALHQIIDYLPIPEGKSFEGARLIYRNFEFRVKKARDEQIANIIQYALFQRAIFEAWAHLLEVTRPLEIVPHLATQGFAKLLDLLLKNQGEFLDFERRYLQNIVFNGKKIIVREDTKKALSLLVLVYLNKPGVIAQISTLLLNSPSRLLKQRLQEKGQTALLDFQKNYELACKKNFKSNYRTDLGLTSVEREALIAAEETQKRQAGEGKTSSRRKKVEVDNQFEQLVEYHIKQEIELAMAELKKYLGGSKV